MIARGGDWPRDRIPRSGRFSLGILVMTPGVRDGVPPSEMWRALRRHAQCDWGEVNAHDRSVNDQALDNGGRLLSVYESEAGTRFWIITEADRSVTTVLLPDEY